MKETKTNKPLFDFKKKYTKRSIAEFLLTNGVDKSTTRHTNTPESSYDRWANDIHQNGAYGLITKLLTNNIVYPEFGVTSSKLNDVIISKYRDYLYRQEPDGWEKLNKFSRSLEPKLTELRNKYKSFEESVIGNHIGTEEEANDLYNLLAPTYEEYVNTLSSNANFMQFLKEFIEKELENKE